MHNTLQEKRCFPTVIIEKHQAKICFSRWLGSPTLRVVCWRFSKVNGVDLLFRFFFLRSHRCFVLFPAFFTKPTGKRIEKNEDSFFLFFCFFNSAGIQEYLEKKKLVNLSLSIDHGTTARH